MTASRRGRGGAHAGPHPGRPVNSSIEALIAAAQALKKRLYAAESAGTFTTATDEQLRLLGDATRAMDASLFGEWERRAEIEDSAA